MTFNTVIAILIKRSCSDLCQAGEVNQGETKHFTGVELQGDGLGEDAFVFTRHPVGLVLDLYADLVVILINL